MLKYMDRNFKVVDVEILNVAKRNEESNLTHRKFNTDGWVESSPLIASDGTVYFGSNDNQLYAIGN